MFGRWRLLFLALLLMAPRIGMVDERPNIVLILADDLGYGDLGCYSSTRVKTPHLDRMAREGMRFTDFHANAATCSPTRAALLTGRYQQRVGIEGPLSENSPGLRDEARTIAEYLSAAGYATGAFGKWHLGSRPGSAALPNRQGFDEFIGPRHGGIDYMSHVDRYGRLDWWHNDQPLAEEGYVTDLLTEHAVRFIERPRDVPFFAYLSHNAIHFPWMAPEQAAYRRVGGDYDNALKLGPSSPDEITSVVARMIERMDHGVGQVLEAVRKLGPHRKTLVLFTSDNGGYLRNGPYREISSNGVLRGQKTSMYEGGHRVPCIAWWPSRIAAGKETDALTMTMDLLPTFLACADVPPPIGEPHSLDGINLMPLLTRGDVLAPRTLFWRAGDMKAVRQGSWKLVIEHGSAPRLYHLANDLEERRDLADIEAQRVQALVAALAKWERQFEK